MTNKVLRADGTTEITNIKSLTYSEKVNSTTDLRPGCVSSACLELEVYGTKRDAPDAGEVLTYYQVDDENNQTLIGTFYADPVITTRNTYKLTAFDAAAKLDADFSATLKSIQSSFPMTIYSLVSQACTVAGVTLGSSSWPRSTQSVKQFYSDNVTCRDILSWAAEIACRFVRCNASGSLQFEWYADATDSIGTTSGTGTVPYKQDGLSYENFEVASITKVSVVPPGVDGAAYNYTATSTEIQTEASVNITTEASVDLVTEIASVDNILVISGNLLLTSVTQSVALAVAANILSVMNAMDTWRPASAKLFSFNNPFRAGDIVTVTDSQGVTFKTLVMEMQQTAEGSTVKSSGNRRYDGSVDTSKKLQNLNAAVVTFTGDVVFKSDLSTSGSTTINGDNITTGTISASRIDAANLQVNAANITGTLTIGQLPSTVAETSDIPTAVSELTNDSGFQTATQVTTITQNTITTGNLIAQNLQVYAANILGTITASGLVVRDTSSNLLLSAQNNAVSIGGFTVTSNSIYNGKASLLASNAGVYIGTDGIACGSGATAFSGSGAYGFKLTTDGDVYVNKGIYLSYKQYSSNTYDSALYAMDSTATYFRFDACTSGN